MQMQPVWQLMHKERSLLKFCGTWLLSLYLEENPFVYKHGTESYSLYGSVLKTALFLLFAIFASSC